MPIQPLNNPNETAAQHTGTNQMDVHLRALHMVVPSVTELL